MRSPRSLIPYFQNQATQDFSLEIQAVLLQNRRTEVRSKGGGRERRLTGRRRVIRREIRELCWRSRERLRERFKELRTNQPIRPACPQPEETPDPASRITGSKYAPKHH